MSHQEDVVDAGLDELGVDALLVVASSSKDPDLAVFVGPIHLGHSFLLRPAGQAGLLGYLVDMERDEAAASGLEVVAHSGAELDELRRHGASESEVWSALLAKALDERGLKSGRIALAGHAPAGVIHTITDALKERGFEFEDGHQVVRRLRKAKSKEEIEWIRTAAAGTCAAFRRVAELLGRASPQAGEAALSLEGEPLTAGMLRREVAMTIAPFGLEQPEGNIVACGSDAGVPHTQGSDDRVLHQGEPLVVDLYPRGRLFADCTRTFCVGSPLEEFRVAHELCRQALEVATRAARVGVPGKELQAATCALFEEHGFPTSRSCPGTQTGYVHGLGHGVGYELHELPSFRQSDSPDGALEVGDVFTLEPGLYDPPGGWGVRIEDLLWMTPEGPENLTALPYDFDPKLW